MLSAVQIQKKTTVLTLSVQCCETAMKCSVTMAGAHAAASVTELRILGVSQH